MTRREFEAIADAEAYLSAAILKARGVFHEPVQDPAYVECLRSIHAVVLDARNNHVFGIWDSIAAFKEGL